MISLCKKLFYDISRARWYTQLNFQDAFNLIRIKKEDEWKTTFKIRYDFFKYLIISFNLINTLITFQKVINELLKKYLNVFVTVYLNDIFIYLKNKKKYEEHVRKILQKLKNVKLWVKLKKFNFYVQKVKFLKYIIKHDKIKMNEEKTKSIREWSKFKKLKNIQTLLKFTNFYKDFIKDFFQITYSLNQLLRKEVQWD